MNALFSLTQTTLVDSVDILRWSLQDHVENRNTLELNDCLGGSEKNETSPAIK